MPVRSQNPPAVYYFDHNATSPLCAAARQAWLEAAERFPANPASPHRLGARAETALNAARERLAVLLGCSPFDLVWTSGATEAANAILHHLAGDGEGEVWLSAVEHPCVLAAARRWLPGRHRLIPVSHDGRVQIDWVEAELRRGRPRGVGVMAANNETGVLQPWREVHELCRAKGVPFLCDAVQWLGKLPAAGLGACDFLMGCAHKFGGPPGIGFLKCPPRFRPLLVGGPQQEGRRAGTENVPGALALVAALEDREKALAGVPSGERERWRDAFVADLRTRAPGSEVLGENAPRLWNTVAALLPASPDCRRRWVVLLDKLGFAVSSGSACASGKEAPSHVLLAMGVAAAAAGRMVRFSTGWESGPEEWARLADGIAEAVGRFEATCAAPIRGDPAGCGL